MESLTRVCPDCQENRTFLIVHSVGTPPAVAHLATCRQCGLALQVSVSSAGATATVVGTRPQEPPILRHQTADLPAGMAEDLLEACRCYSFAAYRGAALLARRSVEQAVVMLGVPPTRRTLHQKIHWLLAEGHLPQRCKQSAVTLRDVGNAASHGASGVSRDEAGAAVSAALSMVTVLVARSRSPESS